MLDRILDTLVVPGYTNVGYALRGLGGRDGELERMDGKVALVTGATSGLGLAAAEGLARLGAGVRMLARDPERGERARGQVANNTRNDDVALVLCDLGDLGAVRACARDLLQREPRLD